MVGTRDSRRKTGPPGSSPVPCETGLDWWRQVIESCYRKRSDSGYDVDCSCRPDLSSPGLKLEAVRAFLGPMCAGRTENRLRRRPATLVPTRPLVEEPISCLLPPAILATSLFRPLSCFPLCSLLSAGWGPTCNAISVNPDVFFRTYRKLLWKKDLRHSRRGTIFPA
jgi:hypothetical protein